MAKGSKFPIIGNPSIKGTFQYVTVFNEHSGKPQECTYPNSWCLKCNHRKNCDLDKNLTSEERVEFT